MPSGKDRKITIVATLDSKQPNGHAFMLGNGKGGPADLIFDKNKDDMKWDGYYVIEFTLDNQKGANLAFSKDRDKVLWACPKTQAVNNCPPEDSHMDTVFYVHPTAKIEDKKLYVINTDMEVLDFVFAFNFLNQSEVGPKYVTYDPGGSNKNGGTPPFVKSNSFAAIALGVCAGLVAFFGSKLLLDG